MRDKHLVLKMEKINSIEQKIKRPSSEMCRLCMSTNATIPVFPKKNVKNSKVPLVCKIKSSVNILVSYYSAGSSRSKTESYD